MVGMRRISVSTIFLSSLIVAGCGGSGDSGGGLNLVYASGEIEGVKIMRTDGSHQSVVQSGTFGAPSLSANGRVFETLFTSGNDDIWSMKKNGTDKVRLTTNASEDFRPCVSPDGSKVAFVSQRDGNSEIYVMDGDGSNQVRLTNNAADDSFPAISADGTKVVFVSTRDGDEEIYSINVDGTGLTRLTNNAAVDKTPAWSPDGTQVVFSSNRGGNHDIYIMDADGSNVTQLTNTASDDESSPSFKLDGSAIFYTLVPSSGPDQVFRMNPNGTGATNLSDNANDEFKTATWVY